jgi:transglutaminase-like putative cysteine protease
MYDIRQFKPALYTLLILGMSGFALAAQSPGMWALSVGAILFNGWLLKTGRFRPLPRVIANLITLLALLYIVYDIRTSGAAPILVIGQFLVLLQLVKLYEQRANRDYAQLLVLSLLLIVAASINTASLAFGLLLMVYLFLSLYCCLLFHLKVETDQARAAIGIADDRLPPGALRHDQRFLARSMRNLTLVVSAVSVGMAVLVFLFFPRGTGAGLLNPIQFRQAQPMTGFSDQVNFQNVARIQQNDSIIAHVRVWHRLPNGTEELVQGTEPLLLRGTTLNLYNASPPNGPAGTGGVGAAGAGTSTNWQWSRGNAMDDQAFDAAPDSSAPYTLNNAEPQEYWRQEISLDATGTTAIFAMPGAFKITSRRETLRMHYSLTDEVVQSNDQLNSQIRYEVWSRNRLDPVGRAGQRGIAPSYTAPSPVRIVDPKIEQFARRPEVCGTDASGKLLADLRNPLDGPTELDGQIAQNIEHYLRTNFTYTLDLTDARKLNDVDPMVAFLYDFKKGHCEYFAGAMTLLCQSLGMDARMVVGFKCDDYNAFNSCYVVRQSHAHAWVEVRTPAGWTWYDPTSAREDTAMRAATAWGKVKHFFDYLEYTWANAVIAYDRENRANMIERVKNVDAGIVNMSNRSAESANSVKKWFSDQSNFILFSSKLLTALMWLMVFALVGAIGGFLWERYKLRKRAARIGLADLPTHEKLRLARQLAFYDELLRLLEKHNIRRPPNLTPMEFSSSVDFLPSSVYDAVRRLTSIFYRIRYGRQRITFEQQRRLHRTIDQIGQTLASG